MVSDFGTSRYCKECEGEIVREGEVITMYEGKKICKCQQARQDAPEEEKQ